MVCKQTNGKLLQFKSTLSMTNTDENDSGTNLCKNLVATSYDCCIYISTTKVTSSGIS